jgi:hypothetical protein
VHALELGEALGRLRHEPTVHAPDATGAGFFRDASCRTACVAAAPAGRDVVAMVESRIADYLRHFESARNRQFDIWHAQDGISGNALATLKERGLIQGFARTVTPCRHVRRRASSALQLRSITAAAASSWSAACGGSGLCARARSRCASSAMAWNGRAFRQRPTRGRRLARPVAWGRRFAVGGSRRTQEHDPAGRFLQSSMRGILRAAW